MFNTLSNDGNISEIKETYVIDVLYLYQNWCENQTTFIIHCLMILLLMIRVCFLITKVVYSNQILDNELQIRESNGYFSTESKLGLSSRVDGGGRSGMGIWK